MDDAKQLLVVYLYSLVYSDIFISCFAVVTVVVFCGGGGGVCFVVVAFSKLLLLNR